MAIITCNALYFVCGASLPSLAQSKCRTGPSEQKNRHKKRDKREKKNAQFNAYLRLTDDPLAGKQAKWD